MMDLENVNLLDLQTSYMKQDITVRAMCEVLNPIFQSLAKETKLAFIYGRIDELDDDILDELAWQFHVDFYDVNFPVDTKRSLIKNSDYIHKIKGTPKAVELVLDSLFGKANIKEWFEYSGDPYTFMIDIEIQKDINNLVDKFLQSIDTVKNTRSHLDGINFYSTSSMNTYFASAIVCGEDVTIYPWSPSDIESRGDIDIGIANSNGTEEVTIYPL